MSGTTQRVKTAGIASEVRQYGQTIGHVFMADYDNVAGETVIEDADAISGPTVMVRSSRGSYHLYGLKVRPWDEVEYLLEESAASEEFVAEMSDRRRAVLRNQPKLTTDNETVVPSPTPIYVSDDGADGPISKPHAISLSQLSASRSDEETRDELEALVSDDRARGETLSREIWQYTDDQGGERHVRQ